LILQDPNLDPSWECGPGSISSSKELTKINKNTDFQAFQKGFCTYYLDIQGADEKIMTNSMAAFKTIKEIVRVNIF
jgi:hypothetical protein